MWLPWLSGAVMSQGQFYTIRMLHAKFWSEKILTGGWKESPAVRITWIISFIFTEREKGGFFFSLWATVDFTAYNVCVSTCKPKASCSWKSHLLKCCYNHYFSSMHWIQYCNHNVGQIPAKRETSISTTQVTTTLGKQTFFFSYITAPSKLY